MIAMNDFKAEPSELAHAEKEAIERVLHSGSFILGQEVREFEEAWADFCGAQYCVGVANGTDAIEIALRALNIGTGDEVITTPMTAMATVMAILRTGATPVLADIDPETALMDLQAAQCKLSPRTKAVVLVHLYGQARYLDRWKAFCEQHQLALVEDCAQSHGARWGGRPAGTFGTFGAFSFYPTKNLGAKGDAGALITDSAEMAERARAIRNYGSLRRNEHREFGVNSRLDEMQAAILSVRLQWLSRFNARRAEIAARYFKEVRNPHIQLLSPPSPNSHAYHLFVVRCEERRRLAEFLKSREIESLIHYPIPAHQQPFWKEVDEAAPALPNAERHARECLSIPCHPQLTETAVSAVIQALNVYR